MSARSSPFRSHLMQQWTRSNQKPPLAVVTWLKPTTQNPDEGDEDEHRHTRRHHHSSRSTRSHYRHLDSASFASSSQWNTNFVPREKYPSNPSRSTSSTTRPLATVASEPPMTPANYEGEQVQVDEQTETYKDKNDEDDDDSPSSMSTALQSLLLNRRTATRLSHKSLEKERETEHNMLIQAMNRAVACAQMAPNHRRTEPFSFKRILASSSAAQQLAEISYQVALKKTNSPPSAESKRKKWLGIPAFLVTLVHKNQASQTIFEDTFSFEPLPYMPPESEQQLEDYAAACAAVQNALLSLHSEGIGTKWATGPVIQTSAFRELVSAEPTDRVAALIMVGGLESTHFANDREEYIAKARRNRRRSLDGDLLVDLP